MYKWVQTVAGIFRVTCILWHRVLFLVVHCVHIRIPFEDCLFCTKVRMPWFTLIQMKRTNRTLQCSFVLSLHLLDIGLKNTDVTQTGYNNLLFFFNSLFYFNFFLELVDCRPHWFELIHYIIQNKYSQYYPQVMLISLKIWGAWVQINRLQTISSIKKYKPQDLVII